MPHSIPSGTNMNGTRADDKADGFTGRFSRVHALSRAALEQKLHWTRLD